MKNQIEKTIAAAVEPILDDLVALEKRVEKLQTALDQLQQRDATPSPSDHAARVRAIAASR